ncbi:MULTISPECIES: sensor histidine kinase [unclassified Paraburkholderia]|uniref:sensor histidine kinase n=1 Tax=unclassified Paraburkholderia TaxID=2615204 RepID=UPI002AAF6042|nr:MULTISPECIES: ATP-binding protein [unclassified Paraburkholderia]
MSFVRLIDLRRTTSFRLSVLFLGIFGGISVPLFAYLYFSITGFETKRVDDWLGREYVAMQRSSPARLSALFNVLAQSDPDQQRPNGLFKNDGQYIAGSLTRLPHDIASVGEPFTIRLQQEPINQTARCIAANLPGNHIAMRCQNARELNSFNSGLVKVLLIGAAIALAIGLVGAALIGLSSLRRLDAVTASIRQIVDGDLSQRLPTHRRHDDLESLVRVVNGMLDEIERLMNEVKGVCDAIAHDLRTPLTTMIAGLERVQRRDRTVDDYRQALNETLIDATDMLHTFNALLRISEIESGVRRESFVPVDMAAIVSDVYEYYEASAEEKRLTYRCEIEGNCDFHLKGDPNLLFEALANLIENAIKFTPTGGWIVVSLVRLEGRIQFSVHDDGPGIPENEHQAVLQRFYRGETSRHTPGNGLGLSLSNAVAAMHGMTLRFNRVAKGCRVMLIEADGAVDFHETRKASALQLNPP